MMMNGQYDNKNDMYVNNVNLMHLFQFQITCSERVDTDLSEYEDLFLDHEYRVFVLSIMIEFNLFTELCSFAFKAVPDV